MAYIDREKAIAYVEEQYRLFKGDERKQAVVEGCVEALKFTPTADVEEVVRCKNCIHKVDYCGRVMCAKNARKIEDGWAGLMAVADNEHYCSYGERKPQKEV